MSESELREFVQKQRTLRESRQTFKAMVESGDEPTKKVQPNMFAAFEED